MVFVEAFVHIFYVLKSILFDLVQNSEYSGHQMLNDIIYQFSSHNNLLHARFCVQSYNL